MLPVHIRWLIRRDMSEVLSIEFDSHEYPWTEEDFVRVLRQRNIIGMVAESQEKVIGYMIYELHKKRLHLMNFAVHSDYRRQKVGTQMVKKLMSKLSTTLRTRIKLEISEDNLRAHLFFRSLGFHSNGVERNFYDANNRDAYKFIYRYKQEQLETVF